MPRALAPRSTKGNGEFIPMTAHVDVKCMLRRYLHLSATDPVGRVGANGRKVGLSLSNGLVDLNQRVIADPTIEVYVFLANSGDLTPNCGSVMAGSCLCRSTQGWWTGETATWKTSEISVEAHGIKIMNAIDVAQRFFVLG